MNRDPRVVRAARLAAVLLAVAGGGAAATAGAAPAAARATAPGAARVATISCPIDQADEVFMPYVDAGNGRNAGVMRIAADGTRSVLSDNHAVSGQPKFGEPARVTVEPDGSVVVLDLSPFDPTLIRVDPATGTRTLVTSNASPAGHPNFGYPQAVAAEPDGNLLVVDWETFSGNNGGVIRVDPATGTRTVMSKDGDPWGHPNFDGPVAVAVAHDGTVYALDGDRTHLGANPVLMRIDPATGARTLVSSNTSPAGGPVFEDVGSIAVDAWGDVLVLDRSRSGAYGRILRVDAATGERRIVSGPVDGTGPKLLSPRDIVVDPCGNVLVADSSAHAIYRVDESTGNRTLFSDDTYPGSVPAVDAWTALAVHTVPIPVPMPTLHP